LLLEAFLSAVISALVSPELMKIREEILVKVNNRIKSPSSLGEGALEGDISNFSEEERNEIWNTVVTTFEEYDVSKEIKTCFFFKHVIRIMNGIDKGREYSLKEINVTKDIRIGKCPVCEIRISHYDRYASRHHAMIFIENDDYFIRDICSRNGTWVNGLRIEEKTKLHDRDRIEVGKTLLMFNEKEEAITVISKAEGRKEYHLNEIEMRGDIKIGRCPINEIRIDEEDLTASRHHARLFIKDSDYFIEDIWSLGGTFVNDIKIDIKRLEDKDKIRLGNTLMQFRMVGMGGKDYVTVVAV